MLFAQTGRITVKFLLEKLYLSSGQLIADFTMKDTFFPDYGTKSTSLKRTFCKFENLPISSSSHENNLSKISH